MADNRGSLVMAGADWCPHCKNTVDTVKAAGLAEQIQVVYCDKDQDNLVCQGVQAYPTFKTCNADHTSCEVVHTGGTTDADFLIQLIATHK